MYTLLLLFIYHIFFEIYTIYCDWMDKLICIVYQHFMATHIRFRIMRIAAIKYVKSRLCSFE